MKSMMKWFLVGAALAPTLALASRLGVVNFANGSTHPTHVSRFLIDQAKASTAKAGHVILLRGGASPIGSRSFNFVLSGERTAAIRNRLVAAGIPRRKIVSQFVGVVNRGAAAADRQVIIDATTRAALGMAVPTGQEASLVRLEGQVQALEAAVHQAKAVKAVPAKARRNYTGSIWYATRTTQFNNGGSVVGVPYANPAGFGGGIAGAVTGSGDNYQARGYGVSIRTRRPMSFNFWTPYQIPLTFSLAGLSQTQQVANPVMQDTQGATYLPDGVLFYPINSRDSVSTQYLHGSIKSLWNVFGLTVTPGIKIGWLGEQSLSGGESSQLMFPGCTPAINGGQPCQTVTEATTSAVGGSAISVTPSLAIGGKGWQIGYSQSPWGADGYNAPRVLMGTVAGRGVRLTMGMAFPDCSMCGGNGSAITMGKILKVGVHGDGWGGSVIWVGGEQFQAGGMTTPATLAQALAPYNPSHPWDSYNPGITVSLKKRLARGLWVEATYGLDHQSGGGYNRGAPNIPLYSGSPNPIILPSPGAATAVTKTEELSLRGRF